MSGRDFSNTILNRTLVSVNFFATLVDKLYTFDLIYLLIVIIDYSLLHIFVNEYARVISARAAIIIYVEKNIRC